MKQYIEMEVEELDDDEFRMQQVYNDQMKKLNKINSTIFFQPQHPINKILVDTESGKQLVQEPSFNVSNIETNNTLQTVQEDL